MRGIELSNLPLDISMRQHHIPDVIQRPRDIGELKRLLAEFPVTAILGPRQSGKTTLAGQFNGQHSFDLENPRDQSALADPQLALEQLSGLIVIDEVQRLPEVFPLVRYLVDHRPEQRYLILGSASRDLIRQSSESLAGRIAYHELGGLSLQDVGVADWRRLWLRGGLPRSFTAAGQQQSQRWRSEYVATFVERDMPQFGFSVPAATMRRFWTMLCHYHGQVLNYAEFARSFGMSDMTVRKYVEMLVGTFMVRLLQPWHANTSKRLVRRPKVYVRDTGILHSLLSIESERDLASHNKCGASWEGFALEVAARAIGKRHEELYFWATHSGAEVDLFWQAHGSNWAIETKYTSAPRLTPSMSIAVHDLDLKHLWVMYPGDRVYPMADKVTALPITAAPAEWQYPE
jgi:predicted AAA+ superfamily ATPase